MRRKKKGRMRLISIITLLNLSMEFYDEK